jgi:hypothetical protein
LGGTGFAGAGRSAGPEWADSETRQQARRDHAVISMRHLHTKHHEVLATDQNLFLCQLPDELNHWVEKHSTTYIENLLQIWKLVVLDNVKAAHTFAIKSVRPLYEYFTPIYTPPVSGRPPLKPWYKSNAHTVHDRRKPCKKSSVTPS